MILRIEVYNANFGLLGFGFQMDVSKKYFDFIIWCSWLLGWYAIPNAEARRSP
jgi:hypothetical protein